MNRKKVFEVTATTLSPLYTGEVREKRRKALKEGIPEKIHFPVRLGENKKVYIPFKGPVRATLEKLLPEACDSGKGSPCGKCIVCEMFGSLNKRGNLIFDFLVSDKTAHEIVETVTCTKLNRETGTVEATFKAEVVKEDATFRARVVMYDYKDIYLELFKKALEIISKEGIGGWVSRGYGRMKFEINEVVEEK